MRRRREQNFMYVSYRERPKPRRRLLRAVIALALVFSIILLTNYIAINQVRVETQRVTVQNLHSDLENWSILHFSDLHGQYLGKDQQTIRRAIEDYRYSTVVFTGDMIGQNGDVQPFLDLIALLPTDVPKFFIPGDSDPALLDARAHGNLTALADWALRVQDAGVIILDEPYEVKRGKGSIWYVPEYLYSLDLDSTEASYQSLMDSLNALGATLTPDQAAQKRVAAYQLDKVQRVRELQKLISADDVQIVLSHTPVTGDYMTAMLGWQDKSSAFSLGQAALILSGHYCGGQWLIPGVGPLYVPELGWFPDESRVSGLSYLVGIPQYVSPGLGATDAYPLQPGRLYNPPTVSIIYLTTKLTGQP